MLFSDRICKLAQGYLLKFWPVLSLLTLLLCSPISSLAQSQGASSYLAKIDLNTIEQLLELGRQGNPHSSVNIELPTNDGIIEATLVLNQIQSAKHFKSVETSDQGIKEVEDEVYSYKSVVLNTPIAGDFLRLTINVNPAGDYWVYGLLKANGVPYSIILSSELSKSSSLILSAQSASGVNVTVAELSREEGQTMLSACGVEHADEALEALFSNEALPQIAAASCPQVVQIATDADFEYFQAKGSSSAGVNTRIRAILNGVEAIYQAHFNISFQITFQNVFTTAADPYTTTVAEDLLFQFTNHWNTNFRSSKTYDIAHLWTGKILQQGTIGVAFVGAVCSDFNYGLSQLFLSDSDAFAIPLTAHEIGHNFGANHGACNPSNLIMCPSIQSGANQFSSASQAEINAALPAFTCLSCAAGSFTISGTIFDGSGNPIQGVNVNGGSLGNVTSNASGIYTFANVPAATYTITPTKTSFTFSPSSASITVSSSNVSRNFTGTLQGFTISGTVTNESGSAVSGVTISAGAGGSTTTSGSGTYSLLVVPGTYTVTPSKSGFTFVPSSVSVTVVSQNVSRSFVAIPVQVPTFTISGVIKDSSQLAVPGVSVNIPSLGTVVTDSSGSYQFLNVLNGNYTITPTKLNFLFNPSSSTVSVNGTNVTRDFSASCALGFVRVGNDCIIPVEPPPAAPTNVKASDGTNDKHVRITWVASAQASALAGDILAAGEPITYTVYRSRTFGVLGTAIVSGLTATAFNDTSAEPLIIYFYSIKAVRGALESEASNQDSGVRDGNELPNVDSDGDGVNDSLEQIDGSDPTDAGSFKLYLGSPAYIKYNTFLNQFNFLELVSTGSLTTDFLVTVYKINGQVAGMRTIRLAPQEQFDVDINSIVNQRDTYGVVRIDFDPEAGEALVGRMSNYRLNPDGVTYSFVLTRELRNPVKGATYATGNSIDPQGQGFLVPNWAEIINLAVTIKTFTYNLYSQTGNLLFSGIISVPPFGEVDIQAGHEFGQGVYLSEIIPQDSNAIYIAGVARYSSNAAAGTEAFTYNFAIYLDGRKGTGDTLFAPTSNLVGGCWSQSNWVEVANTLSQPVAINVLFRNEVGASIGSDSQVLAPKSQFHFQASAILGKGQIGLVEINSSQQESVISQSAVYFHDCAVNALQTAYATQARVALSADLSGTYNRFLSMSNKFHLIGVANGAQSAALQVRSLGVLLGEFEYSLGGSGSTKVFQTDVNQVTFPDSYGTLALSVAEPSKAVANLIRFREVFGRADFAVSTAVQ